MKRLGNTVQVPQGSKWETEKLVVIKRGVIEKFRQNPHLQDALVKTGETTLVEATGDLFWGSGAMINSIEMKTKTWKGRNHLGEILMNIRGNLFERH